VRPNSLPTMNDTNPIIFEPYDPTQETKQLEEIRSMISTDLSEPYSIYVFRYFLYQWGDLCYMVRKDLPFDLLFNPES
jgi:hypothetical protein